MKIATRVFIVNNFEQRFLKSTLLVFLCFGKSYKHVLDQRIYIEQ